MSKAQEIQHILSSQQGPRYCAETLQALGLHVEANDPDIDGVDIYAICEQLGAVVTSDDGRDCAVYTFSDGSAIIDSYGRGGWSVQDCE
jgi:hypothetical protein